MELFKSDLKIDFLAKGPAAFVLSGLLIAASVYLWISQGEEKFGIDYRGGHELVVDVGDEGDSESIRGALSDAGIADPSVQSFESGSHDFVIRLGNTDDAKVVREQVKAALEKRFPGKVEIQKTEFVGPTIGNELRQKAMIALFLGLIGILVYVSVRFEFAFALGAVVALFHDVIIATGFYLLFKNQLSMGSLAAALTIVGYSVNDTIVIFDRVREDIFKSKTFDLRDLMNQAMNSMLSRTIITSLLTFFSALALYIFGGGAIKDLSLFLVAGIVAGSYSTVFIASPVALWWHGMRMKRLDAKAGGVKKAAA